MAVDGVAQGLRVTPAAPTVIASDDVDATVLHHCNLVETLKRACRAAKAIGIEKLAREDFRRPVDTYNAHRVAANGPDGSSNVSAMSVVVSYEPITVDTDNVHSKTIVDKPISIVVDGVVVAIRELLKQLPCKIQVSAFDRRHNHDYTRVGAAGRQAPRFRRPNVGARGTPSLARVMQ